MKRSDFSAMLLDERGAGTIWAIFWLVVLFGIGGLAVDMTSAYRTRTMLQATADAAALSGTIDLPVNKTQTTTTVVESAVEMAEKNLAVQVNGTVLRNSEVYYGDWDHAERKLVAHSGKFPTAVMVTTRRDDFNENPVPFTFLRILRLVLPDALTHWNVHAQAAAERFVPECILRQGLIARGIVDVQSNNIFRGDLCIHSEDHVEVNNNNVYHYQDGVTVSMPDQNDIVVPNWDHNQGLRQALRSTRLDPRMVDHVPRIIATLKNPALDDEDERTNIIPAFISNTAVVEIAKPGDFDAKVLQVASITDDGPKRIYHVACSGNQKVTLSVNGGGNGGGSSGGSSSSSSGSGSTSGSSGNGGSNGNGGGGKNASTTTTGSSGSTATAGSSTSTTSTATAPAATGNVILKDFVLVSDCQIDVGNNVQIVNAVLAASGGNGKVTDANISFGSGDILGASDFCFDGGGVQIYSTASIHSPAQMSVYGIQIVAQGNVSLAAQAYGINGVNVQAGGRIDLTSNNDAGGGVYCDGGAPRLQTVDYFRLVY